MSKKVKGTVRVESMYNKGDPTVEEEEIEVQVFPDGVTPGGVSVRIGETHQPAAFHSVQVQVEVTLPCYVEETFDAIDDATEVVYTKLDEELAKYGRKSFRNSSSQGREK
jgi:hypothetical protein